MQEQEHRHSVLVVEDRRKWREILDEVLNRSCDVTIARTKDAAIRQVGEREFDAVILNPNLLTDDDFSGVDVLDAVVRHRPLMPCILLAGTLGLQASQIGRYGYQIPLILTKGPTQTMEVAVDTVIRGRKTVRELLSILDTVLSDAECDQVMVELRRYYTHLRFQPPPRYTDNTKRQRLAYMISVLAGRVAPEALPEAMCTLCNIVQRLMPHDQELGGKLDRIRQAYGIEMPFPALPYPPIAVIRELMEAAFSVQDLRSFCLDRRDFEPLRARFSPLDGLVDMVARVIDYCLERALLDRLLDEIRDARPEQYALFESRLQGDDPQA